MCFDRRPLSGSNTISPLLFSQKRIPACPSETCRRGLARTVSTNTDLHALLEAAGRINYHAIALQGTNSGEQLMIWNLMLYKFVVGDFDAKIGMPEEEKHGIGRPGPGLRNESNRFVGLLSTARLFHGNSIFMKKEHRRWTWKSPNGTTYAEIDHILTNRSHQGLAGEEKSTEAGSDCITSRATGSQYQLQISFAEDLRECRQSKLLEAA
ncbi:unnamed protein product [Strongylus vulgaris]|uniref:Uncharacterized protein n=1 Tax=Strongylus vulgaris TaxID=40348 RepID=A0A3P7L938_STRVU|nr:unnamed protein product [Strongylus vulgaris]